MESKKTNAAVSPPDKIKSFEALKIGRHLVQCEDNSEDIVVTDISNDNEISVPIMYYIDDNGRKVYDFEEMAKHFEQELAKLDTLIN